MVAVGDFSSRIRFSPESARRTADPGATPPLLVFETNPFNAGSFKMGALVLYTGTNAATLSTDQSTFYSW